MNNLELQATRKLLMLDVSEAAELIAHVSPRTWQYWESGRNVVPQDVADEMQDLLAARIELMNAVDEKLERGEDVSLPFHVSFDTYVAEHPGSTRVDWRLSQSVAALYYTEGHARLSSPPNQLVAAFQRLGATDDEAHAIQAAADELRGKK